VEQRRAAERRKERAWKIGVPALIVAALIAAGVLVTMGGGGTKAADPNAVQAGGRRMGPIAEGEAVPSFSAPALAGGRMDWASFEGKPTVLAVWAPWCPHCQKELPILGDIAPDYPGVRVATIATSIGDHPGPSPEGFMAEHDLTWPTAVDSSDDRIAASLGVNGFPTLLFVGADGTVKTAVSGELPESDLRAAFDGLQQEVAKTP
jgi:thiol-disulfide isomerase/thioredoxin